jgi:hypothetical protein
MIGLNQLQVDKIPVHAINANFKRYLTGWLMAA